MKRSQLIPVLGILAVVLIGLFTSWNFFKAEALCSESTNEALCISDKAVVHKDLKICNTASTDVLKDDCAKRAVPVLATDETSCNGLNLETGKNICLDYVRKIASAKAQPTPASYRFFDYAQKKVVVTFADGSTKEFNANISDTDDKQIQGLSFRQSMRADEAMLFTYDKPRSVRYHMKDMLFSIDIIYADKDGKVVSLFRSLPSCLLYTGECFVYGSANSDVTSVLEILPQGKDAVKIEIK